MWQSTKYLIFHKIGGLIANNIDVILVSKFLGFFYVVVYTSYNYITTTLLRIIGKISNALFSIVGNTIVTLGKDRIYANFLEYNTFVFFVACVICGPLLYAITPFVKMFYGPSYTTNSFVTVLFVLILYFRIIRLPLYTYSNSAGLFGETRICTFTEAIINLSLSLLLIRPLGIAGLLSATIISYVVADFIIKPSIIHGIVFHKNVSRYYKECIQCFLIFPVLGYLDLIMFPQLLYPNRLLEWFAFSCFVLLLNSIVFFIYFKLIKKAVWSKRLGALIIKRRE